MLLDAVDWSDARSTVLQVIVSYAPLNYPLRTCDHLQFQDHTLYTIGNTIPFAHIHDQGTKSSLTGITAWTAEQH